MNARARHDATVAREPTDGTPQTGRTLQLRLSSTAITCFASLLRLPNKADGTNLLPRFRDGVLRHRTVVPTDVDVSEAKRRVVVKDVSLADSMIVGYQ